MMEHSEIMAAFRFAAVALLAAKTALFVVLYRRVAPGQPTAAVVSWFALCRARILLGLAVCSAALTFHQAFWWLHEMARARQMEALRVVFAQSDIVTAGAYSVLYIGVGLLFSGWLEQNVGRLWPAVAASCVSALWIMGAVNAMR